MKRTMSLFLLCAVSQLLIAIGPTATAVGAQETATNRTIVEMVQKGIPEEKIITYINESKGKFDVSGDALRELDRAGVSKSIIIAMEKTLPYSPAPAPSPPPRTTGDTAVPDRPIRVPVPGACDGCVRYRVVATGFEVVSATIENVRLMDGRGDEVFINANVVEMSSVNTLIGTVTNKRSVYYGDTEGRGDPVAIVGIPLRHAPNGSAFIVKAGRASPTTGGLLTGDRFPGSGESSVPPPPHIQRLDGRFIPFVLWEGDLRVGPNPNGVMILPTIWENDFAPQIWNIWNDRAATWLGQWARTSSSRFRSRRAFLEQEPNVMEIVLNQNDFDRPIGMAGSAFNPLAASPELTTFAPFSLFLTADLAEAAVAAGDFPVTYRDGRSFGPGEYKLMLRVERVPR
ncbi:MAG TPA: hypothetical protein VMZ26_01615 [Pyrinomonadaceae bacterium]|nr:hypothetical protein [Pyrinomonadaceae bacterium]